MLCLSQRYTSILIPSSCVYGPLHVTLRVVNVLCSCGGGLWHACITRRPTADEPWLSEGLSETAVVSIFAGHHAIYARIRLRKPEVPTCIVLKVLFTGFSSSGLFMLVVCVAIRFVRYVMRRFALD